VPELLTGDATLAADLFNCQQRHRSVVAAVSRRPPRTQKLRITVADQGIGIRPEQLDQLFQPFTQADGSPTRQYGGSGLGLAIARGIARLMGGDAGVESEYGAGSSFWATVRLQRTTAAGAAPDRPSTNSWNVRLPAPLHGTRCWSTTSLSASRQVDAQPWGCRSTRRSTDQAVERVRPAMDMQMPC
jgi:hypothetical protein